MTLKEAWEHVKFTAYCGNSQCLKCREKLEAVEIIEKALFNDSGKNTTKSP